MTSMRTRNAASRATVVVDSDGRLTALARALLTMSHAAAFQHCARFVRTRLLRTATGCYRKQRLRGCAGASGAITARAVDLSLDRRNLREIHRTSVVYPWFVHF